MRFFNITVENVANIFTLSGSLFFLLVAMFYFGSCSMGNGSHVQSNPCAGNYRHCPFDECKRACLFLITDYQRNIPPIGRVYLEPCRRCISSVTPSVCPPRRCQNTSNFFQPSENPSIPIHHQPPPSRLALTYPLRQLALIKVFYPELSQVKAG